MYLIEKTLKGFCAAHRIINGYQGKCRHLHGHNYEMTAVLSANALNDYGFVVDFADVTQLFSDWLLQHIDHATLVASHDKELLQFLQSSQQKHYIIPHGQNTSVEVLAEHFFKQFDNLLINKINRRGVSLQAVKVWETKSACATFAKQV